MINNLLFSIIFHPIILGMIDSFYNHLLFASFIFIWLYNKETNKSFLYLLGLVIGTIFLNNPIMALGDTKYKLLRIIGIFFIMYLNIIIWETKNYLKKIFSSCSAIGIIFLYNNNVNKSSLLILFSQNFLMIVIHILCCIFYKINIFTILIFLLLNKYYNTIDSNNLVEITLICDLLMVSLQAFAYYYLGNINYIHKFLLSQFLICNPLFPKTFYIVHDDKIKKIFMIMAIIFSYLTFLFYFIIDDKFLYCFFGSNLLYLLKYLNFKCLLRMINNQKKFIKIMIGYILIMYIMQIVCLTYDFHNFFILLIISLELSMVWISVFFFGKKYLL